MENTDISKYILRLGESARCAASKIANATTAQKNAALKAIAESLEQQAPYILSENEKDMKAGRENDLTAALLDRLELDEIRISAMVEGCHQIAQLPDPVGEITGMNYRPSGIQVGKMRVPLGVIGIIYESRPNVTIDAAALCLKAGNAVILRGGSEAIYSNLAIVNCVYDGLSKAGLGAECVQLVETTDRAAVGELIQLKEYVDVIVPRGGKSLTTRVSEEASVPVIKHLDGICHVYIDSDADVESAIAVAFNAKARRYGVCGAMETLLVDKNIAPTVLPRLCQKYTDTHIELRGCEASRQIVSSIGEVTEEDWHTEYLDGVLSIRLVDGLDEAIDHINHYGSHHTDSILTQNLEHSQRFLRCVDSSSVMVNASTQFADGFEYGLGAEIGISTDKLHVRGPVGLEGLTTQKYIVIGAGHIRP
ncbi:MAG: glutamate-5-semialdehyde dehydrogenase [Gammaproteobacteria bacterium]|nr:glutamate-5-semialdehyde dehydrogenase [Gammaproteobacteria bacterium]